MQSQHILKQLLALSAACFAFASFANSQTTTSATASADWNNAGTWNNGVPDASFANTVINGGFHVTLSGNGTSGQLSVASANNTTGTLTIDATGHLTVGANAQGFLGRGNNGTSRATMNINGGRLTTTSHFNIGGSGSGTLNVAAGSTVSIANELRVGTQSTNSFGVLNIDGAATVTSQKLLVGRDSGTTGTLSITGSGASIKSTEDMIFAETATLQFNIGANGVSYLQGEGETGIEIKNGATLDLNLVSGADISSIGNSILLLNAAGSGANSIIHGTFTNIDWGLFDQSQWALIYSDKQLNLVYQVPEASTVALLLSAGSAIAVFCVRRRRQRA